MLRDDSAWHADIVARSHATPGEGWGVEFSVPLAQIGIDPGRDRLLKMNFVRNVIGQREYLEVSNWFPTFGANKDLESRGWLVLQ